MSALRLVYSAPKHALSIICATCGVADSSGTTGPSRLESHGGGYARTADWLCACCSAAAWGAYLGALAKRRALIAAYREGGWAAVARIGQPGVQLLLFGGA